MQTSRSIVTIVGTLLVTGWLVGMPRDAQASPQSVAQARATQQETSSTQTEADASTVPSADPAMTDTLTVTTSIAVSITEPITLAEVVTTSASISNAADATVTVPLPTPTPAPADAAPIENENPETQAAAPQTQNPPEEAQSDPEQSGVLEGTIIANRSAATIRFFVEGQFFALDGQRALGLDLPRVSAVLNLYNCDANTPESQPGCYWDPYLLQRDGFYEVVTGAETADAVNLILREAGTPEVNEIWIQNRTGKIETVVYRGETFELAPATVHEFVVDADEMPTFFLRSCVEQGDRRACEWLPVVAETGIFYSLSAAESAGGLPGSTMSDLTLEPVLTGDADEVVETPPELLCTLLVPALNVRSGPGLEYEIVAKIRGTETEPATVLVVGRNTPSDWLAVDERIAAGGWITSSASYIACDGALSDLPEAEVTDGRLAPTPAPAAVPVEAEAASVGGTDDDQAQSGTSDETDEDAEAEATPQITTPPPGLALLVVNNAFDHEIRFTLDQKYRPEPGPSEIDLQPGESTSIVIYPDFIPFSVSSPWNSLSGNTDFYMEPDESRTLWLLFIPDPDGSGQWILQF